MLGVTDFGAYVVAVIIFLAIPGPGNLALLISTAKGGLRGGSLATLGVIAGDQVLIWAAVAGLATVLLAVPALFKALQWAGALYLGWLGLRLLVSRDGSGSVIDIPVGQYFRQSFVITLLNPKAIVFYMAFFPLFIDPSRHHGLMTFGLMAITAALLTALYGALLCSAAHHFAGRLGKRPAIARWLNRIAGLVMLGFALRMLLGR